MCFGKDILMISFVRPFWAEMEIPLDLVKQEYLKYLSDENESSYNTDDAIEYLRCVIEKIQNDLIGWEKNRNARNVIIDLYTILDKCFRFYIKEKKERTKLAKYNVNHDKIYEINRNMALNVITSINMWLDNTLIFQNVGLESTPIADSPDVNDKLFVDLYIYGLVSRCLSLLSLNRNKKTMLLFRGIKININEYNAEPVELLKYVPETFFSAQILGNQSVFEVTKSEYKNADKSDFGTGFKKAYGIDFLLSLRLFKTIMKYGLKNGKVSVIAIDKARFIQRINNYSKGKMDGEAFYNAFVLDYEKMEKNLNDSDVCIWKMGVNKFRHEIRPFICLKDNTVYTSFCALDQATQLWLSFFTNGGMIYTNDEDKLTKGMEKRNNELSNKLVRIIISMLEKHYGKGFLEIEVDYERIFGKQETNYGDYDIIYYAERINELFIIESKFFSDSLHVSSYISDYEKCFEKNGYYDHCRKRCDLVLKHPQKIKEFIGVEGEIKVHFLFVSSKPLQIDFTDKDGIVSFPCVSVFDKYLEGKLLSEDGKRIVRPTKTI